MDKTKDDLNGKNISPKSEEENKETKDKVYYPSVFSNHNPSRDLKKLRGKNRSFQSGKRKG